MKLRNYVVLAVAGIAATPACSVDRDTQLTVAIASETEVPTELDSFTVRVTNTRTGETRFSQDYSPKTGRDFPATLAVIPADEDSLKSPIKIEIEGRKGNATALKRTTIVSYIEGRNVLVAMPLRMACFQFRECEAATTCAGGECVDATAKPSSLLDFAPNLVTPVQGQCFDEEQCLAQKQLTTVDQDCTFPITSPDAVNVAIRWAAAPQRILALDSGDAQEGWSRIAGDRGRLSKGACDSHFQRLGTDGKPLVADWAKEIYVTTGCAAKTNTVPSCYSNKTGHSGIGASSPP